MKHGIKKRLSLRKDLGLLQATACGVGIIVGAGIYVLLGSATNLAGNSVWLSFFIAALLAIFTGLSYAELSSMFPQDASEYLYVEEAFNKRLAFIIGYAVILGGVISAAAVALGFAGYLSALIPYSNLIIIGILITLLFSFINFYGIKESSWLNVVLTTLEVGGLIFIILISIKSFGSVNYLEMPHGFTGIFNAAALIFFAFLGFESVVKLSEETKNAKRVIPLALILSIIITTILYILVAISAVSRLGWEKLATSKAPLADVAFIALGSKAFLLLGIVALFSTGNTILIILITTSRIMYGMGNQIKKLKFLTKIHKKRRTPYVAIFLTMVFSILFILLGKKIDIVAGITNFSVFFTFIFINATLIWLRYKKPRLKRRFKVPLNIGKFPVLALLGVAACVFMIYFLEINIIIVGAILILVGFLLGYLVKDK